MKKQTLGKTFKWLALSGVLLAAISLIFLSIVLKTLANSAIEKDGRFPVRVSSLRLNLLTGSLSTTIKGTGETNKDLVLNASTRISLLRLLKKQLIIHHFTVYGINLRIDKEPSGSVTISGIGLPIPSPASIEAEKEPSAPIAFQAALGSLHIRNSRIVLTENKSTKEVTLKDLSLRPHNRSEILSIKSDGTGKIQTDFDLLFSISDLNVTLSEESSTSTKTLSLNAGIFLNEGAADTDVRYTTSSVSISIGSIETDKQSRASYQDGSTIPPLDIRVSSISLRTTKIATSSSTDPTDLVFSAYLGDHDRIQLDAKSTVLDALSFFEGKLKLESIHLPQFSPVLESSIGYQIEKGILNLDSDISIKKNYLDTKNEIHILNLEMDRLSKKEISNETEQSGIPINTLLLLLRDSKKDIHLKLPIKGDLNDPKVGVGGILGALSKKAAAMAARKALETSFPLLKTARIAKSVTGFILKLRFDPIVFVPGETTLTPEAQTALKKVAEGLTKKEKVRLNICAWISKSDQAVLGNNDKEKLLAAGKTRADNIKNYLIENFSIAQERLFLCAPEIDTKDDTDPRVELSI